MALVLTNLDEQTRGFMLAEVDHDVAQAQLYLSPRLSEQGRAEWEMLLRAAVEDGDDDSLAIGLRAPGRLLSHEQRRTPRGGLTMARVPATAAQTLAEGEFNRFYMRGLWRWALENSIPELIIYRAKNVDHPRPESQAMVGKHIGAAALLEDLRTHQGIDTARRLPPGPNSGLSTRLP